MKENCKTCLYEPVCDQPMDGCAHYQPEVIWCKDCRKHNSEECPLVAYRGKAQGHEFDYQYCVFGERKEE